VTVKVGSVQGDIVEQGLELMLYGMGTVVVFLTLLIVATSFMSWIIGRYFPETEVPPASVGGAAAVAPDRENHAQLVAVITAAIHRYRAGKR
jgi:oxaloacetate decarboxylase gamma subunit